LRFLVSNDKLFELAGDNCKFTVDDHLCGGELHFKTQEVGTVLQITCLCDNNHFRKWTSSEVIDYKNKNRVFVSDSMLAASVIVSGNNYAKFKLLCKGPGLELDKRDHFSALPETLRSACRGRSVERHEQCCEKSLQGIRGHLPLWGWSG